LNRQLFSKTAMAAFLVLLPVSQSVLADDKILWSVTPYMWATKTTYDLKADGSPVDAGTINFGELMDEMDTSFQVVVEAGRGHWSLMTDITYIETSDDETVAVPEVGTIRVDRESEQIYADVAVAYWPWGEEGGLSLLGGIRYTDLDDENQFRLVEPDTGEQFDDRTDRDFTDALVGVRYHFDLAERWRAYTKVDYGFGDSEGIFLAEAVVRYSIGKSRENGIMVGYRYKDADFDDSGLEEDYEYWGPLLGFNFRF